MDWLLQSVGEYVEQGRRAMEENMVQFDATVRQLLVLDASSETPPSSSSLTNTTTATATNNTTATATNNTTATNTTAKEGTRSATAVTAAAEGEEKEGTNATKRSLTWGLAGGSGDMSSSSIPVTPELVAFVQALTADDFLKEIATAATAVSAAATSHTDEFQMSVEEQRHATSMLNSVRSLARIRYQLIPSKLSEYRFWRIYFILVSRFLQFEYVKANGPASPNPATPSPPPPPASPQLISRSASYVTLSRTSTPRTASLNGKSDEEGFFVVPSATDNNSTTSDDLDQMEKEYVTEFELSTASKRS